VSKVIRVSIRGVANYERKLTRAQQSMDTAIRDTLAELEKETLAVYRSHAVGGSRGNLAEGLQAQRTGTISRPGFQVESTYRDPKSGYDPLSVTRFGHRTKLIRPRDDRRRAVTISTKQPRGPETADRFKVQGSQQALAFFSERHGKVIFRHYVKGQDPASDWVKDARAELTPILDAATERLGRRVQSSLR
jgi:hypothetical protein